MVVVVGIEPTLDSANYRTWYDGYRIDYRLYCTTFRKVMQTFLPYADFKRSLETLDYRRLGKQRVEAFQLLVANGNKWALAERTRRTGKVGTPKGWVNHPAAVMWRGYDDALMTYMNASIIEWTKRGYNNTMSKADTLTSFVMPPWFGWPEFHASHRSNLLRKDAKYYSQFNWTEPDNLEYVWPSETIRGSQVV